MLYLHLMVHKKRRFGRAHLRLRSALLTPAERKLLQERSGKPWPVAQPDRPWRPLGDHESWRRARILELSLTMTFDTLADFMQLKKSLWVYLRQFPPANQDRPHLWWVQH